MSNNKFESLLELLINEENDKAEALFHEIVVEKSRDIYEGLAEETTAESKEETKEDDKKEEVKETESTETKDDEVKTDEGVFSQPVQKTDEESIEEIGGDATDALIKDISSDQFAIAFIFLIITTTGATPNPWATVAPEPVPAYL